MRLRKIAALLFLLFCGLVVGRFLASYRFEKPADQTPSSAGFYGSDLESTLSRWEYRKDFTNNLRSLSAAAEAPASPGALPAIDQLGALEVYTREARVGATTDQFDADVTATLAAVDSHGAEVRLEQASGIAPNRTFRVILRVPVDRFDSCVESLRAIGELQTSLVVKEDKTEEVRQRFAERDALKAYAGSLGKLRQSDGKVSDLLKLEAKIQEVEQQIQTLSVGLGEYVKEESFNNVNYSLSERELLDIPKGKYPVTARLASAIVWAVEWEAALIALLGLSWLVKASVLTLRASEKIEAN